MASFTSGRGGSDSNGSPEIILFSTTDISSYPHRIEFRTTSAMTRID